MTWPASSFGRANAAGLRVFGWFFAALLAAVCLNIGIAEAQEPPKKEPLTVETSSGPHTFEVEVAKTREQQSRGLMFRRSLGPRDGMIFLHDEPQYITMWMRNTYIPLDMIFIYPDGKVHRIEESAEPLSERIIESGERVTAVLELAGGMAAKLGLKPGDMVRHPHFKAPEG